MTRLKRILFIIMMFPQVWIVQAQENSDKLSLDKGTVENQFNFVLEKSSRYEDYKVIKEGWLYALKTHVLDSVKTLKKGLKDSRTLIQTKQLAIDSLKNELVAVNDRLSTTLKEKNSLRFFGILMGKVAYNSLMWTIILGLAATLVFLVMLFKRNLMVTNQTKIALQEAKEEFETFRKRALEREEKLSRKYLDELNKYKTK
jgi:hypothetical protein